MRHGVRSFAKIAEKLYSFREANRWKGESERLADNVSSSGVNTACEKSHRVLP